MVVAVFKRIRVVAQEGDAFLEGSLVEGKINTAEWSGGTEDDESDHLETLKLFWNPYCLHIHQEFLGYIPDEIENKSVKGTILSVARLDAWIVFVGECFAEQTAWAGHG